MANLRERSGQLALVRKELYQMEITVRAGQRDADSLRAMLEGLVPRPKTIV
jgi:hypothetical protein